MGFYIPEGDDWRNPSEYVIAFKGTTWYELNEWKNNAEQLLSSKSADMWDAINYSKGFANEHPKEITFVGHSKGAAEALAAAVVTNNNAIVFNPAIPNMSDYNLTTVNYPKTATVYVVRGEFINSILGEPAIGDIKYINKQFNLPDVGTQEVRNANKVINGIVNHLMWAVNRGLQKGDFE